VERELAGKPSGAITFHDFHGKTSEYVRTLAAGGSAITLESLFSAGEWLAVTDKRVVLPAGVERGNSASLAAAISIGTTPWVGNLTFEVAGTISGDGGAANSGVGGNAFNANIKGASGQKIALKIASTGVLRGGGGGGGKGGTGGGGTYNSTVTEGPTYSLPNYVWFDDIVNRNICRFLWAGVEIASELPYGTTSKVVGAYTYTRGANHHITGSTWYYYVSRSHTVANNTSGGAGGNGGAGQGYGQSRGSGVAGAAGGTNAGNGGTGGTGGLYGATGNTGATGANGNRTTGLAGTYGGAAGYAIENLANATLTNSGSVLGRT